MVHENELMFKGNPNIVYPKAPGRGLSFKCFKCPSTFDRKESLLTHSSLHGSNKRFQCHACDYAVSASELLAKHMAKHQASTEAAQQQSKMDVSFPERDNTKHDYSPHGIQSAKKHSCSECPATFSSRTTLLSHLSSHRNRNLRPNKCHKCSFATRRKDLLEKHLQVHGIVSRSQVEVSSPKRKVRKYTVPCPECPETFICRRDLGRHLSKHDRRNPKGKYKCHLCSFSIHREGLLKAHLLLHQHDSNTTDVNKAVSKVKVKPIYQDQEESESSMEMQDVQSSPQNRVKPFPCPKCPFRCASRQDLESHMNCHNLKKTFACSYCDYSCNGYGLKLKHEKLHQNQKGVSKIAAKITMRNHNLHSYRAKKGASTPFLSLNTEEYERLRRGNPAITYKPFSKTVNGRRKVVASFKCLKCPYQTAEYAVYVQHQTHHGSYCKHRCKVCDYSHRGRKHLAKHMLLHSTTPIGRSSSSSARSNESRPQMKQEPIPAPKIKSPSKSPIKPIVQRVMPQTQGDRDSSKVITPLSSRCVVKSFRELYSAEPSDIEQANSAKFLIQRLKLSNFMSIGNVDLTTTNILTFQGIGKSASIAALLIGIGYDVLLEDIPNPETLCGINVQDLIKKGSEESTIELTLSLHSAPKLAREYGSHLQIIRTLQRGLPLRFTNFKVHSADTRERFPREIEIIGKQRIRRIQKHIGINSEFHRLLLLDDVNLRALLNNASDWYKFYRLTYDSRKLKFDSRLELLRVKNKRLQGEIEWRKLKMEFFKNEISLSRITDSDWKQNDEKKLNDLNLELDEIFEAQNGLLTGISFCLNELNKLTNVLTGRLKFRYQEFLHRQEYTGSILVDDKAGALGIWIAKDTQVEGPKNVEEAEILWVSTPNDLQRLAVVGLFFALIDIAESSIFFMDAFSTRSSEFSIPSTAFPLLFELIEKKCSQGHQFVASLPDDTDAFPVLNSN